MPVDAVRQQNRRLVFVLVVVLLGLFTAALYVMLSR